MYLIYILPKMFVLKPCFITYNLLSSLGLEFIQTILPGRCFIPDRFVSGPARGIHWKTCLLFCYWLPDSLSPLCLFHGSGVCRCKSMAIVECSLRMLRRCQQHCVCALRIRVSENWMGVGGGCPLHPLLLRPINKIEGGGIQQKSILNSYGMTTWPKII